LTRRPRRAKKQVRSRSSSKDPQLDHDPASSPVRQIKWKLIHFKNSISFFENVPIVIRAFFPPIALNLAPRYNTNSVITAWGRGAEFTIGYNYKWDAGDNSIIPTHF
jgi:hypothetical protein